MAKDPKLSVMVSSTVYTIRPLLRQVYGMLDGFQHEVIMSDRHTVAVDPRKHNFESCLAAVGRCDLFLGFITAAYGTGIDKAENRSITHMELLKAIELEKPRFMLCEQKVMTARVLINGLSYNGVSLKGAEGREGLTLNTKSFIGDLRTIDMLDVALREEIAAEERTNHWVAEYESEEDVRNYVATNFDPDGNNREFLKEMLDAKRAKLGAA